MSFRMLAMARLLQRHGYSLTHGCHGCLSPLAITPSKLSLLQGRHMAGHSKWANIKHAKAATDKKRALLFARCSKNIIVAVKEKGGDANPGTNPRLQTAIQAAKDADMPKDKIEGAIKIGTGEGIASSHFLFECAGPGGVQLLIEAEAERRMHVVPHLNKWFGKYDATLGKEGSSMWAFNRIGVVEAELASLQTVYGEDADFEDIALEIDADEVEACEGSVKFICDPDKISGVSQELIKQEIELVDEGIVYQPHTYANLTERDMNTLGKLFDRIYSIEFVTKVTTNLPPDDGDDESMSS